jgi:hypothetical protein
MSASIKYIRKIELTKQDGEQELLSLKAKGLAEISNIYRAVLVPKDTTYIPGDGILELDFMMLPESGGPRNVEMEVNIVYKLKDLPAWVRGIRVNASENSDIELI